MSHSNKPQKSPFLPRLFSTPFKLIPSTLHSQIMPLFLNKLLSEQIADGDLDFLEDRFLCINVIDLGIQINMSFTTGKLVKSVMENNYDLMIQASLYDFLMLAARQQDPDTLVFQRKLIMQGDTELGLELKNFLDGLDLESTGSFNLIESFLQKSLPVYKRLFS
ncbi:MAG: SCP2 sterol-binding domain-containing protein [Gammaproteobacteria bacterium]|nr:SCP2 sterol-binding domain-containing protein [Gammaproteobacteria bacterium]